MSTVVCPQCSNINPFGAPACLRCGYALGVPTTPPQAPLTYQQPPNARQREGPSEGRKLLTSLGCCGVLALAAIVVIGVIGVATTSKRPTADPGLVTFATGLGEQLGWQNAPVDQTSGLPSSEEAIGFVAVAAPKGQVEFRRWPDVPARKAAQAPDDPTVAGCGDVTVAFRYEDKESAGAEALTTTNLLQLLNGGTCEVATQTSTTRAPRATMVEDGPPPYDLAMDSCAKDRFGFVTAKGTVRNNTDRQRSYFIEVKIVNGEGVRIGYGNGFATGVNSGETATWSVLGTIDFDGAVTCKYSAEEI